jgi:hypothetical protein
MSGSANVRRILLAAMLAAVLAACGVARSNQIAAMTPDQLAVVTDKDICQGFMLNRGNANLLAEVNKRQLGDCSPDHFTCASWGASFGRPKYVQCRAQLDAAARTSQATQSATPQPRQLQCVSVSSARGTSTTSF